MSILGLMENTADIAQTTPDLSALPSTNTERFGVAWDAAQAPDRYWNAVKARHTKAEKIIDDLHAMTGERLKNPFDAGPTQDEIRANPNWSVVSIRAQRLQVLREKTRAAKDGMEKLGGLPEDYLDVDSIDPSIASEAGALRARDERMTGTGGGAGAFLGGMAGETVSPHGILSSFIPVTRLGTAAAQATLRGFALNVAREAAFQGSTQGLAQSFATLIDYQTRKAFGTEQTTAQIFEEILGATVGGFVLGGAFRATHLGILKLASRGVEVPPAVLDAARVMEEGDLYGNKNPLRVNPGQNEVATDQAMGAAVMGRAASPDVEVGVPNLHEAARRLEPELMRRYDAAVAWRDEARAILAPDLATIDKLKQRMETADAAIAAAGPQTREVAERMGATARMAREIYEDAVFRRTNMDAETTVSTSMRQQAAAADLELRELIPEINKVMTRAGEEVTAATRAAEAARAEPTALSPEAGISEARLSPEEVSRVRELQEQIADYEQFRDKASPEDAPAWQQAIDEFNGELAKIMDLDVPNQAPVQAAVKAMQETPSNPMLAPRPDPEPVPARKPSAAATPEDKAMETQLKQMLEAEDGTIPPTLRRDYQNALQDEKEANAAIGCVMSAGIL